MGGRGSGRTKESRVAQAYEGSSAKLQTQETKEFHQLLRRQMADRLFEVQRIYPSGKKASLGTIQNTRLDTIGKMFGAGEYELFEMDRSTGETTNKPPLRRVLHPGKYPLRPEFAKDPMDAEMEMNPPALPAHVAAMGAAAGGLDQLTPSQIYERAKQDALQEFERRQELTSLKEAMARMEAQLLQPRPGADQQSSMAQLREMMGLVKELMPPPVPNPLTMPLSPADSVRQGVEAIKLFQTELKGMGLDLGAPAAKAENPALLKLIDALGNIASQALPALAAPRPLPVQRPAVPMPAVLAGAAAGAAAAAPAAAAAATPAAAPAPAPAQLSAEDQRQMMMQELAAKLRQDQGDQLARPPRSHIDSTAAWLRQRMMDPAAGPVWNNLPNVLGAFSDGAVVEYIGGAAPDLVDNEAKKGWLVALVELLKKKG